MLIFCYLLKNRFFTSQIQVILKKVSDCPNQRFAGFFSVGPLVLVSLKLSDPHQMNEF